MTSASTPDSNTITLTEDQRTQLIDKLCADMVEGADRASMRLWDMARDGFVGFAQRSGDELLEAHYAAFDYDFLGPDKDDDEDED